MIPKIKDALESIAGRSLTTQEQSDIDALLPSRNDVAIAAIISTGRTQPNLCEIGNGTVLEVLGIARGNVLLDLINNDASLRYVKPLLEQGRLHIGASLAQTFLQSLVPAVLTKPEADALCALGKDPNPINFNIVSNALNIAEGRMVL